MMVHVIFKFQQFILNLIDIIVQTLFASRFDAGQVKTNRNQLTNRVWHEILANDTSALMELIEIKHHHLREHRTGIAHPEIFISDLHIFIDTYPSPMHRSTLAGLQTMEIWRGDIKEQLFAD